MTRSVVLTPICIATPACGGLGCLFHDAERRALANLFSSSASCGLDSFVQCFWVSRSLRVVAGWMFIHDAKVPCYC